MDDGGAAIGCSLWLAGCTSSDPPQTTWDRNLCADWPYSTTSGTLDGVALELLISERSDPYRLSATVRNGGSQTFWYLWSHCQPCDWDSLSPGESLGKVFEWNGKVWEDDHDGGGRLHDAERGRYTWGITFHAAHSLERACGQDDGSITGSVELAVR